MPSLCDHDPQSLSGEISQWGYKPSHAPRILRAFYSGTECEGLPQDMLERLGELAVRSTVALHQTSGDGTEKLLVRYEDGKSVETVLMPSHHPDRAALCVSSQVGCAMGCDFCASTRNGLERDLSAGEIAEQFVHARRVAGAKGRRISSVVFMGMGEPMHNLDAVLGAIVRIADPGMGNVGWRQVTVSTVGVVPGIHKLAEADLNVHLALSLHAPDDATRGRLVPVNRRWPVAEIVSAARAFQDRTGRIVTIEYCLLGGVNDSDEQATLLAGLLSGFRCHVNVIQYNPVGAGVGGVVYRRPDIDRVDRFVEVLRNAGAVAHRRITRGLDIDGACGQLRQREAMS